MIPILKICAQKRILKEVFQMKKNSSLFSMFILLMLSLYCGMTTLLKVGIILNLAVLVADIFRTVRGWQNGRREEA